MFSLAAATPDPRFFLDGSDESGGRPFGLDVDSLNGTRAGVYRVPDIFVFDLLGSKILDVDGIPVVSLSEFPQIGPAGVIKRLEDLVLATVGLAPLAPVFAPIAVRIKRASSGPVFCGHTRIGQNGRTFKRHKFRTMATNVDQLLKECWRKIRRRKAWEANCKLKDSPSAQMANRSRVWKRAARSAGSFRVPCCASFTTRIMGNLDWPVRVRDQ